MMKIRGGDILKLICIFAVFSVGKALESKVVNIALKTNWAYTPLNQEISEFIAHESRDLFWSFLDSIGTTSGTTESEKYQEAFRVASTILSPVQVDLLEYAIRVRYFSPAVQLHRQLFSNLFETKDDNIRNQAHSCSAFAYFNEKVYCSVKELEDNIDSFSSSSDDTFELDYRYPSSKADAPSVILYATIGTESFQNFHKSMKELASKGKLNYIFRHLVPHSDETLTLGGYGVELALKNLEYKTVDDSKVEANNAKPSLAIEENEEEINGILFGTLQQRKPKLASDLASFKAFLLSNEEQFEELKVWELKDLGFQAAQRIISSTNPLRLLRDISQNFPTHATSLSKVKVNETLKKELKENGFGEPGRNLVLINGRAINPETIEPFSLFSILHEELDKLNSLMRVGIPKSDAFRLMSLPPEQREEPVFKVLDNSIQFVNDLKKDGQYANWRTGVYEIFQRVWPGSFRFVAENFFTVVLIVDPKDPNSSYLLTVLMSMIQQNFPVRFGVIFATQNPNSYSEKLRNGDDSLEINEGVEFARAFLHVKEKFGGRAALQLTQIFGGMTMDKARDKLVASLDHVARQNGKNIDSNKVLSSSENDEIIKENAKFAVLNGFHKSPLAFMNGVPLVTTSNRDLYQDVINKYFELTGKLQTLVRMGEIRDDQDIYQTLMSKNNVLDRFSPLVLPSESRPLKFVNLAPANPKYSEAITSIQYYVNSLDSTKFQTHLVVVDLNQKQGQQLALEAIKSLATMGDDVRVGIVHNSDESDNLISRALVASFKEQVSSKVKNFATKLLGDLSQDRKTEDWVFKIAEETLNFEKFKRNFQDLSINEVLNKQSQLSRDYFNIKKSQSVVISNGRVIDVTDGIFMADDFKFLGIFEGLQRVNKVKIHFGGIPFTVDPELQTANFISDAFMTVISLLGLDEIKGIEKYMIPSKSTFTLQKENENESFVITAVLDPLSLASQRISSILEVLVKSFEVKLQVILNPQEHSGLPLKNFYSYVLSQDIEFDTLGRPVLPTATFNHLPVKRLLTLNLDVPESWLVTPVVAVYDMDNIKLENLPKEENVMYAEFQLQHIVIQGNCLDHTTDPNPPRGLEVVLATNSNSHITDTIVMSNFGYFQLKANPGLWKITLKKESRSSELYDVLSDDKRTTQEVVLINDFSTKFQPFGVTKKPGKEQDQLLVDGNEQPHAADHGIWDSITGNFFNNNGANIDRASNETIHVFSLASGHLYERFLKIMMLTVVKNTRNPVKFWLLANFLSPKFKDFIPQMAQKYGFQYELVTYKWPGWLNKQTEKQRIIWGYKILFLDVLFPLDLKKVVYVDADQVVRSDLRELWEMDLHGAPYAYTPFCEDNHATDGFRFWKQGFWQSHLQGLRYHISALYLVDLQKFRRIAAGDQLRATYDSLSRDPNSLANLDQDLPNYMQHHLKIHSLPQEWLWCETWCSQESKGRAKTIDLCNNPLTKTPKLENALKIIPDWTDLDNEVKSVEAEVKNRTS